MLTYVFLFEYLQAIDSSFATITKPLSNKTRKTFCEGLKLVCNVFEINTQRDFQNLLFFLKVLLFSVIKIHIPTFQGNMNSTTSVRQTLAINVAQTFLCRC